MGDGLSEDFDRRMFDLGFAAGADIDEDLAVVELRSRVLWWQLGFVLGRGVAQMAQSGDFNRCAMTVGRLCKVYSIDFSVLLNAIVALSNEQRDVVRRAYDHGSADAEGL